MNRQEEKRSPLKLQSDSPTERGDMHTPEDLRKLDLRNVSPVHREEIDFIKLNKEYTSVANRLAMQLNNGAPPTHYRKGVIPKYDILRLVELVRSTNLFSENFIIKFQILQFAFEDIFEHTTYIQIRKSCNIG